MITEAKSGHPGGSLSAAEIVVTLFFDVMRHDPANPKWPDRDRFILSKGHCCPILYAVMAECGYCPKDQLNTLRKLGSIYQGHPDVRFLPALEASTGSLGEGVSLGLGMANRRAAGRPQVPHVRGAGRRRKPGRPDLGSGHVRRVTIRSTTWWPSWTTTRSSWTDSSKDIMALDPLAEKWRSFGWHAIEVDGHDIAALQKRLRRSRRGTRASPRASSPIPLREKASRSWRTTRSFTAPRLHATNARRRFRSLHNAHENQVRAEAGRGYARSVRQGAGGAGTLQPRRWWCWTRIFPNPPTPPDSPRNFRIALSNAASRKPI